MPSGLTKAEKQGEYLWSKDQSVMVFVPAGPFIMGSEKGSKDERPVHEVHLPGYYIDKFEVSWRQWKLSGLPFSEKTNDRYPRPEAPDWGILDNHPVVEVNWKDAQKYAGWSGKRLPSEAEWEKAARGADGREFPWGNEPADFDRAIWRDHPVAGESTAPVDCCPKGASPYGAVNMAGNVYEWCADLYDKRAYARAAGSKVEEASIGEARVLRGGAFPFEKDDMRSAYRYRLLPEDRTPYIGFRTVVSAGGDR